MAKTTYASIDDYIARQPKAAQAALERVRRTIRKAVPTFKLNGRPVLYFAGWKEHYSLYPADARLVAAFKQALVPYEYNGKGTIRFRLSEPVPVQLIDGIARFRAKEVAARATAKAAAVKKR